MNQVYYTKYEHGSNKVILSENGEIIFHAPKGVVKYPNAKTFFRDLFGNPRLSFSRYFSNLKKPRYTTLDLFESMRAYGINVLEKKDDIKRIFYAKFAQDLIRGGYDTEEVLQEIYYGVILRNQGKCPFDSRKSSFGHYVYMICSCVISNYIRKEKPRRQETPMLQQGKDDGEFDVCDLVAEKHQAKEEQNTQFFFQVEAMLEKIQNSHFEKKDQLRQMLLLFVEGYKHSEIPSILNVSKSDFRKLLYHLRRLLQVYL